MAKMSMEFYSIILTWIVSIRETSETFRFKSVPHYHNQNVKNWNSEVKNSLTILTKLIRNFNLYHETQEKNSKTILDDQWTKSINDLNRHK